MTDWNINPSDNSYNEASPFNGNTANENSNASNPSGYAALFTNANQTLVDANNQNFSLGAGNITGTDPAGGNFLAMDASAFMGPINQTVSNLTIGGNYSLSFWYAGAQQNGFTGPTTESFEVGLGDGSLTGANNFGGVTNETDAQNLTLNTSTNQVFNTTTLSIVTQGFSGWNYENVTFTATNTSEVLSFLAEGGPQGDPPFALLGGINTAIVPEIDASSAAVPMCFLFGVFLVTADCRRRLIESRLQHDEG